MLILKRLIPSLLLLNRSLQCLSINTERCMVSIENIELAKELGLESINNIYNKEENYSLLSKNNLILYRNKEDNALELKWLENDSKNNEKPYRIDFISYLNKRQETAKQELISKAIGSKGDFNSNIVIDLTAGIGRDSIIMAAAGHNVIMIERNPILFSLLNDALNRLKLENKYTIISNRLKLLNIDSSNFLKINTNDDMINDIQQQISVYLDPMYAENSVGKKAAVKKETQMLHRILGTEEGNDEINNNNLWNSAIQLANNRIVVKRAINAKFLSNLKPQHQIIGKNQRFDVYLKKLFLS